MSKRLYLVLLLIVMTTGGCSASGQIRETLAETPETPAPSAAAYALRPTEQDRVRPSATPRVTPVPVLKEDMSGKTRSHLTGLFIDKELAVRRPFAVVINNMRKAIPQSGISQADIIYEVLAEGDITRLVAVFQDFDSQKIGPVRSARNYFIDFALDHDAVFVHHGGSDGGYIAIKSLKIDNFDGMALEGVTFWRDKARLSQPGMYEHSSYTDSDKLLAALENKGCRDERYEDHEQMLAFYAASMSPSVSEPAERITVPFSPNYTSVFEYDAESRLYYKFQGTEKHIDEETGEQLAFTNIIIQLADMRVIDDAGRRDVDLVGSGRGYVVTNGQYAPITWEKSSHTSVTRFYDEFGDKLRVNMGKTWICVYKGEVKFE